MPTCLNHRNVVQHTIYSTGVQAMTGLEGLQHLNLSGCGMVQGDCLSNLSSLTALRQAIRKHLCPCFTCSVPGNLQQHQAPDWTQQHK